MKMPVTVVALALLLVALVGAWVSAIQLQQIQPVQPSVVLSGSDFGFRIEGRRGDVQVGKLVVRVDGKWVDALLGGGGLQRITSK